MKMPDQSRTALDRCTEMLEEACADLQMIRCEKARLVGDEVAVQRKINGLLKRHAELAEVCREVAA